MKRNGKVNFGRLVKKLRTEQDNIKFLQVRMNFLLILPNFVISGE